MSRLRGSEGGGENGALDRLAAARQLTERIREAPAYYDVSPADLEAYRAERREGMATGDYDVELVRVPGDSLARPFVAAVCVALLAVHPLEAAELISNVDQLGPQAVVEHISRRDAENLTEALERFGFTTNIRESPARSGSTGDRAAAEGDRRRSPARGSTARPGSAGDRVAAADHPAAPAAPRRGLPGAHLDAEAGRRAVPSIRWSPRGPCGPAISPWPPRWRRT